MTGEPIEIHGITKRFGEVQAVSDLSFTAAPGRVTGFLGPNGSGKTTTLAMLLGLIRPDSGDATIGGKHYRQLDNPATVVGASLAAEFHPAHTGRAHLDITRRAIGAPKARVDEMLTLTGMADAADRKIGGYSLGMRQRLALAATLLGDPRVLVLDEPVNGLDPEGIRWMRMLFKYLADEGKTVLLSSHVLSEVQQTVDDVVVIREGELAYAGTLEGIKGDLETTVLIDTPERESLADALAATGAHVSGMRGADALRVTGLTAAEAGAVAHRAGVPLSHLSVEEPELEASFLGLIGEGK